MEIQIIIIIITLQLRHHTVEYVSIAGVLLARKLEKTK